MAEKTLDVKILNRIDTIANWDSKNPRPRLGEICIGVLDETDDETGTTTRSYKLKVGDGATNWSDLPFIHYTQKEIDEKLVSDGASASKVSFSNDNFTSKSVAAALVELYGLIKGVETNVKDLNDEAYEISYSSSHSGLTSYTNVQQILDYITDSLTNWTTELKDVVFDSTVTGMVDGAGTPIDRAQAAFDQLYSITPKSASDLSYSNALSGLTAVKVQSAIDELVTMIDDLEAEDITFTQGSNAYVKGADVQAAMEAIESTIADIYSYGVSKDLSSFKYDNTTTKIQIDESDSTIYDTLNAQQALEYCITKFTVIKQNLAGAVSVTFDNTSTNIITGTDVQAALEQLDTQVKTNKDDIAGLTASDIDYVNTTSGSTATDVQAELDILDSRLDVSEKASGVSYDDTVSAMGTAATPINTVQKAIEKLDSRLDSSEKASGVSYDDTTYSIGETNVQNAIDNTIGRVKDTEDLVADWDDATLSKFSTNSDGDLMFGTIKIGGTDNTFHKYASEISYDDTTAGMGSATDLVNTAQKAIDKLDSRVDTIEEWKATNIPYDDTTSAMSTSTNTVNTVQKAIESIDSKLDTLELKAEKVSYSNTTSGMTATNVQAGIDELDNRLDTLDAAGVAYTESGASSATTVKAELDAILGWTSADIKFDDTIAGLSTSTNTVDNVRKAIEALDARLDSAEANKNSATDISYDDTTSALGTNINNVQKAIEAIDSKVDTLELKAEKITYDDSTSAMSLGATSTVQVAVEKLDNRLDTIEAWDADDISYTTADTDSDKLTSTNVRDALDEVNNKLDTIAANKNTADDITYDKTKTAKSVSAETVQDAIDTLAATISTTDGKISNESKDIKYDNTTAAMSITPASSTFGVTVQEAIDKLDSRLDAVEAWDAGDVSYTNTTSGLIATNTQAAIDEVVSKLGTIELKAEKVSFAAGTSTNDLKSTDVQAALEEVNSKLDTIAANKNTASDITYSGTSSGLSATDVQSAIDSVYGAIPSAAADIDYTPATGSTITDTTVQSAIDTLVTRTDTIPTKIEQLSYDKTVKNLLTATNGQAAIDELASSINGITGDSSKIAYDPTYATIEATNVQDAIDELDTKYQMYTGAKASYVEYDNETSGRSTVNTVQGAIDKAFSEIDQAVAKIYDNAKDIKYDNADYASYNNVEKALNALLKQVFYVLPSVTSFVGSPSATVNYEIGYTINSVTFTWAFNKTMSSILLTGCSPAATDTTATYSTAFSSDKTFTIVGTDAEMDATGAYNTATSSITFHFYPAVYYGCSTDPTTYDDTWLLSLSGKSLQKDKNGTYNFNAASGEYCYIAWPTSYGTVTNAMVGGFSTSVTLCDTISVTNAQSYVNTYYIYRLNQPGLGVTDMVIS